MKISSDTIASPGQDNSALQPDVSALNFKPDTSGMAANFYSVYELSPKTTAFVMNFFEEGQVKTFVDSIFEQTVSTDTFFIDYTIPKECSYYDTAGSYRLYRNEKLENRLKPYFNTEFYIYGTRGIATTTISNIVFALDPCRTNVFAFCIDKSKIRNIGHPLICSRKLFNFKVNGNYKNMDRYFERLDSINRKESDYSDNINTRVFGQADSLYFTYNDDFKWGRNPTDRKCLFPARSIYIADKNGDLSCHWVETLDLFGIECD